MDKYWHIDQIPVQNKSYMVIKWRNLTEPIVALPALYVIKPPGGRLNKKDGLTRYGDSHVKDKTS